MIIDQREILHQNHQQKKGTIIAMCFPVNIAKFLRAPILKNICERLLLGILQK